MKVLEKCRNIIVTKSIGEKEKNVTYSQESKESRKSPYKPDTYKYKSSYKLKY